MNINRLLLKRKAVLSYETRMTIDMLMFSLRGYRYGAPLSAYNDC
jgi:hypothetical protein